MNCYNRVNKNEVSILNRVVLITGASRGIGAATAFLFAKEKDTVIINYNHSEKEALALKNKIEKECSMSPKVIKADITKEEEVKKMVEEAITTYGKIDVLVNNAGIAIDDEFFDHTSEHFRKVLDTNLVGMFFISQYVSRYMMNNKSGIIINISSNNGIDCNSPLSLDYDASKAGVISLTHNLARALAPYIRVNAVAPGWTKTDSVDEMFPEYLEEERKKIMLERFATPEEIANVILFLASSEASYINNEVIRVDGGIL